MMQIEIAGGIMQIPYFDANLPLYLNYGGLGVLMATELIRSIDASGRFFVRTNCYQQISSRQ